MVSKKIIKKSTSSTVKSYKRRRYAKRSPVKKAATAVIKSIYTCQRKLVKLFTKLARITSTPNTRSRKGFKALKKLSDDEEAIVPRVLFSEESLDIGRLPPMSFPERRTIFLDLDETLVHSKAYPPPEKWDFVVTPRIDGEFVDFYVLKRPGVDEFLEFLGGKFEVVVFTAGLREYASLVLDVLDVKGVIEYRLYRDSCREVDGKFVKDLKMVGRDMRRIAIIDDNPNSYECNPENAIPVRPFVDDLEDGELAKLRKEFFDVCEGFEDMRDSVKQYLASC